MKLLPQVTCFLFFFIPNFLLMFISHRINWHTDWVSDGDILHHHGIVMSLTANSWRTQALAMGWPDQLPQPHPTPGLARSADSPALHFRTFTRIFNVEPAICVLTTLLCEKRESLTKREGKHLRKKITQQIPWTPLKTPVEDAHSSFEIFWVLFVLFYLCVYLIEIWLIYNIISMSGYSIMSDLVLLQTTHH